MASYDMLRQARPCGGLQSLSPCDVWWQGAAVFVYISKLGIHEYIDESVIIIIYIYMYAVDTCINVYKYTVDTCIDVQDMINILSINTPYCVHVDLNESIFPPCVTRCVFHSVTAW